MAIFRMTIHATGPNGDNENVMYYFYSGSIPDTNPNGQAADLGDAWVDTALAGYVPLVGTSIIFDKVTVRGVTDPSAGYERAFTQSGGAAGEQYSYQIAPYVTWLTARFGRSFRGRTRFFPTTEAFIVGSNVDGSYITAAGVYCGLVSNLQDAASNIVGELQVFSRKLQIPEPVTGFIVRPLVGTMRTRAPGVGS